MHVRAALRHGLTPSEIAEVLLHTGVYAGVPASNAAFAIAQRTLADLGLPEGRPPPSPRLAQRPDRRRDTSTALPPTERIASGRRLMLGATCPGRRPGDRRDTHGRPRGSPGTYPRSVERCVAGQ